MRERILNDLKNAMKNQNKELLSVIRMVKGAIQLEEISNKKELNDEEIISIVAKQIKMRKEDIIEFEKAGREDLVNQNKKEVTILERYLPRQLTEEEVTTVIDETIKEANISSIKDLGKLMGFLTPKLKGKADMGVVSKIVKKKLS